MIGQPRGEQPHSTPVRSRCRFGDFASADQLVKEDVPPGYQIRGNKKGGGFTAP